MTVEIPSLLGRGMTTSDQLARHARRAPGATALVFEGGSRRSYAGHPKVAEVALIGVPDSRYGEAPLAIVAPRDPADPPLPAELAAFCRERLAHYKNPRGYSIVGALPRNPSGKVLETTLRQEHSAGSLVAEPPV